MRFFIEFLNNFTATEILKMYAANAFRTSDEIKMADFTINYKIVFSDAQISADDLKIYHHLQKVVDAIRAHRNSRICFDRTLDETYRYYSTEEVHFRYFIKYGENEREVTRLNIIERRIIFAFKPKDENASSFVWLKGALTDLLSYVLREFDEADRVGIVIKQENQHDRKATFPIELKNHLEASIIIDTLNSIIRIKGSFLAGERMTLQVVRIRLPVLYKKLSQEDLLKATEMIY